MPSPLRTYRPVIDPAQFRRIEPLHPRAWRRISLPPCVMTLAACVGLTGFFGASGLLVLGLIPFWMWLARKQAAVAGYAVTDGYVVWRSGWLDRRMSFARIEKSALEIMMEAELSILWALAIDVPPNFSVIIQSSQYTKYLCKNYTKKWKNIPVVS